MLIKGITDEDFVNYKVPSMYIATATCSFKCDKEYGSPICQNSELAKQPDIDIPVGDIIDRYLSNPITHAIVIGGLEPFDQLDDITDLLHVLRYEFNPSYCGPRNEYDETYIRRNHLKALDPVVIYTGYTKDEFEDMLAKSCECMNDLRNSFLWSNVIIKFGRYIPGQQPHYDPVLGVYLASDNQYAERIS